MAVVASLGYQEALAGGEFSGEESADSPACKECMVARLYEKLPFTLPEICEKKPTASGQELWGHQTWIVPRPTP
jgi:hypothetical protein